MKGLTVLHSRIEPYPHDFIINRLILRFFPKSVKPNHITLFRFIATPVVFALIVLEMWVAGILSFVLLAFTDMMDGSMARMRKQVTPWGTLFDPLADKLLVGGVLFILILKYVDILIAGAIIVMELAVIIGAWVKRKDGMIISATEWGKIKMVLQVAGVSLLMLSIFLQSPSVRLIAEWTLISSIGFAIMNITRIGWSA